MRRTWQGAVIAGVLAITMGCSGTGSNEPGELPKPSNGGSANQPSRKDLAKKACDVKRKKRTHQISNATFTRNYDELVNTYNRLYDPANTKSGSSSALKAAEAELGGCRLNTG